MARRKSGFMSDGSSDSGASDDELEGVNGRDSQDDEFAPRRKRRKVDKEKGKAGAWEGIFGEEDDEPSYGRGAGGGRGRRGGGASSGSSRFKAPSFVAPKRSATAVDPEVQEDEPEAKQLPDLQAKDDVDMELDEDTEDEESDADSEDRRRARSPIIRDNSDEDEDRKPVGLGGGGIGMSARKAEAEAGFSRGAAVPRMGGLGLASSSSNGSSSSTGSSSRPTGPPRSESSLLHGGIGSTRRAELEEDEHEALYPSDPAHAMPQGFGNHKTFARGGGGGIGSSASASSSRGSTPQPRQQRSFVVPSVSASTSSAPRPDVTKKDLQYLNSISTSLGARLLAKQGWTPGKGLGVTEDGKAVPIEANKGIARGQGIGKGVRTEQSKREARARGEKFSSDEEEDARKAKRKAKAKAKAEGEAGEAEQLGKGENASWKRSKKVKVKVEHKSYDQLLAEAGEAGQLAGVGKVIDARSGELKEVSSIAALSLSTWTPTSDKTRLPELRHNLRLILDVTKGDVLALAKEGKGVNDRRAWNLAEEKKLRKSQKEEEQKVVRLRAVQEVVKAIVAKTAELPGNVPKPLEPLSGDFTLLLEDYRAEYDDYELDEVVVGAISQILAKSFREWQPLSDPPDLANIMMEWKKAYRYSEAVVNQAAVELYDATPNTPAGGMSTVMTPFESMLNSLWLPKVRSAINNEWDTRNPQAAITLLEAWWPLLPRFVRDNVVDQLILPKLRTEIKNWNPKQRKGRDNFSLAAVIFPWLSLLGPLSEDLLEEAKLRVGEALKKWTVSEGVPEELPLWRETFSRGKWDTLILLNILPKISAHLDNNFEVNPRDQQMGPLDAALTWSSLMRDSIFAQLLEERFFPKWLDTLHFWLIQPNYSAGEVASWYHFWKDRLANSSSSSHQKLTDVPGVDHGFRYGLRLMNDAMALGSEAPSRLPKVDFKPFTTKKDHKNSSNGKKHTNTNGHALAPEVSFRDIAEQHAAQHDLILIPTGRSHPSTGKPLFKVSKNADGRGGVTVYIGEDAVYAAVEEGAFKAVLLEDMVRLGSR